jgi:hypothetical protein
VSLVHDVTALHRRDGLALSGEVDRIEECIMKLKLLIGAAFVAGALALAGPSAINQARRSDAANEGADICCFSCDRHQRAPPPPAPLSLRLSPLLSALLLRAALFLSAVSLLRAGTIPVRLWVWPVLVKMQILSCRPCERRDPYRVIYQ